MSSGAWDFGSKRKVLRDGDIVLKSINLRFSLSDWQQIRIAAAAEGVCITDWVRREVEPALKRLRQQSPA